MSSLPHPTSELRTVGSWAVVYGPMPDAEVRGLDLLIVDPAEYTAPHRAHEMGVRWVLAYLSVGELNENTADYRRYEDRPWLVEPNGTWPSWRVDVRHEEWREHLLAQARQLMEAGYDGLMLDTVSVPSMLESREPERFAGSVEAMRNLARTLRREHPSAVLIPNGGLAVIEPIASEFDAIAIEAAYGGFDAVQAEYVAHRFAA